MICRRCGMESSTTNTCEWCKKPMLPPGGSISAKAKEELIKEKASPQPPAAEPPPTVRAEETDDEAAVRRPESKPPPPPVVEIAGLSALGADLTEDDTQPQSAVLSTVEQTTNDEILMPLGNQNSSGEEGTSTQLYIGDDEEVVRPIDRPNKDGSHWVTDASGRRKRVVDDTPQVPEKVRLLRAALAGACVAFLGALVLYLVKHQVPDKVVVLAIGDAKSFGGALQYGLYTALLLGLMFAALMVNFKLGPVVGFLMGGFLGWVSSSMASEPLMPFPFITGALAGIFVGTYSVKGLKRIVSV